MIRGSDGLDYEDLTARLVGEPAKTHRNSFLQRNGPPSKEVREWYLETYDHWQEKGASDLECHRSALAQAGLYAAGKSLLRGNVGIDARLRGNSGIAALTDF